MIYIFFKKDQKNNSEINNENNKDEIVFLTTIYNEIKFSMIKGILEENKIPYTVKHRGGCSAYMKIEFGRIASPVDIFVRESDFKKAENLVGVIIN
jgi:hypothetical protein